MVFLSTMLGLLMLGRGLVVVLSMSHNLQGWRNNLSSVGVVVEELEGAG